MAKSLSEISSLWQEKISKTYSKLNIDAIGRVSSIGDGIGRVYGLNRIKARISDTYFILQCAREFKVGAHVLSLKTCMMHVLYLSP